MEYVTLNNGVKMPMAGIGTFLLSPDESEASVIAALECGYRLIDTANAYVNEKAVGCAMKRSGLKREEIPVILPMSPEADRFLLNLIFFHLNHLLIIIFLQQQSQSRLGRCHERAQQKRPLK